MTSKRVSEAVLGRLIGCFAGFGQAFFDRITNTLLSGSTGSQPGDFPLGLGVVAGVPILAKTVAKQFATRPGDKCAENFGVAE